VDDLLEPPVAGPLTNLPSLKLAWERAAFLFPYLSFLSLLPSRKYSMFVPVDYQQDNQDKPHRATGGGTNDYSCGSMAVLWWCRG